MIQELSNKILERIDSGNITPLPRWRFLLLRGIFWLFAILSVGIGSLAVGATLFLLRDHQLHGLLSVPHDTKEFLAMIPVVWIVVLMVFTVIAQRSIAYTRHGYRYRLRSVVGGSVVLSVFLGLIFHGAGIGKLTHELSNHISLYDEATYDSRDAWDRPTIGRLAGVIVDVGDDSFSVQDFGGRVWMVHLALSGDSSFTPEPHSTVRMVGILESSSSSFIARSIYEWEE